jgi:hypothetical protein
MKAKELAALLLENPEMEVMVRVGDGGYDPVGEVEQLEVYKRRYSVPHMGDYDESEFVLEDFRDDYEHTTVLIFS